MIYFAYWILSCVIGFLCGKIIYRIDRYAPIQLFIGLGILGLAPLSVILTVIVTVFHCSEGIADRFIGR